MQIDPRHLVQLHTIVESGSFVAAAERLGLTQPGLSRNIRILEARIGVRLLNRGKHGATPTEEGKVLAAYGASLAEITDQAAALGAKVAQGELGSLTIGASFSLADGLLSAPLLQFLSRRPETLVKVSPGATPKLLQHLEEGKLDIVIGGTQFVDESKGLKFEPLIENRLVILARAGHPLAGRGPVPAQALRDYGWVICAQADPLRVEVEAALSTLGISRDLVVVETGSSALIRRLQIATDYLTLVPSAYAQTALEEGLLAIVPSETEFSLRPLGVAYRVNAELTPTAKAFLKVLRSWARENSAALG